VLFSALFSVLFSALFSVLFSALFSVLFSVSALYVVNSIYVYLRSGHFEFWNV